MAIRSPWAVRSRRRVGLWWHSSSKVRSLNRRAGGKVKVTIGLGQFSFITEGLEEAGLVGGAGLDFAGEAVDFGPGDDETIVDDRLLGPTFTIA